MPKHSMPRRKGRTQQTYGPKKPFAKNLAVRVMIAGGIILVVPWFIPSEQGSTLQFLKAGLYLIGLIAFCLGAYFRP